VYENEVTTLFDYVMIYLKVWKLACQNKIKDVDHHGVGEAQWYTSTYNFLCLVESLCYDYTKAVLVDCESLKFSSSMIVAALVSASIEVIFNQVAAGTEKLKDKPILDQLRTCNAVWDSITKRIFGEGCVPHLDAFGRYLVLR
jgi:hypothetical protein